MIVRILERALPSDVRQKWKETLSLDTLPKLAQLYRWTKQRSNLIRWNVIRRAWTKWVFKRQAERSSQGTKFKRTGSSSHAFVTSVLGACVKCNADHPLQKCPAFEKMKVTQRWAFIRAKELCKNCLWRHRRMCQFYTLSTLSQIS